MERLLNMLIHECHTYNFYKSSYTTSKNVVLTTIHWTSVMFVIKIQIINTHAFIRSQASIYVYLYISKTLKGNAILMAPRYQPLTKKCGIRKVISAGGVYFIFHVENNQIFFFMKLKLYLKQLRFQHNLYTSW